MNKYKVTDEVSMTDKILYLVRINGEECMIVDTHDCAKLVADSIACKEITLMKKKFPAKKIYREDEENRITICSQSKSWFGGENVPKVKCVVDTIAIGCGTLTKNKYTIEHNKKKLLNEDSIFRNQDIPKPPPLYTVEELRAHIIKQNGSDFAFYKFYPKQIKYFPERLDCLKCGERNAKCDIHVFKSQIKQTFRMTCICGNKWTC